MGLKYILKITEKKTENPNKNRQKQLANLKETETLMFTKILKKN